MKSWDRDVPRSWKHRSWCFSDIEH